MPLARLEISRDAFDDAALARQSHTLVVMPAGGSLPSSFPGRSQLVAVLSRRQQKVAKLAKEPIAADLPSGGRCVWAMIDGAKTRFEQLARKAREESSAGQTEAKLPAH